MNTENKIYATADEVSNALQVSLSHAYRIIRQLNQELSDKGYIVISGRVPIRYLEERCYGMGEVTQ